MPNMYTYGSEVNLTCIFRDTNGDPAAPKTNPVIAVTDPENTTTEYTATSSPAWTNPSTGEYQISVLGNKVGRWHYNAYVPSTGYPSTDNDPISEEGSFIIESVEGQSSAVSRILSSDELKDILGLGTDITSQEQAILSIVHAQSESKVISHLGYDPIQASRVEYYPRRDLHGLRDRGVWDVNTSHTRAIWVSSSYVLQHLQLQHIPLRSVTSLYVDRDGRFGTSSNAFGSGTEWTEGDEFWPEYDEDGVCRSGVLIADGGWPVTPGAVKVTYTGGYTKAELNGLARVTGDNDRIDASGIKRAVMLTATKAFLTWMQMKKKPFAGFTAGPLKSERLQDYNYTLGSLSDSFAGMSIALPAEAEDELGPFVNYGIQVL